MPNNSSVIRTEAENYSDFYDLTPGNRGQAFRNDDVDIWQKKSSSEHFRVGAIESGEWLAYSLDIPEDGTYKIVPRVGTTKKQNRKFSVSVDGEKFTDFNFGRAGKKYWQSLTSEEIELNKGKHQLRLDMLSSGFSIDYFELVQVSSGRDGNSNNDDNTDKITSDPKPIQNSNQFKSVKIGGGGFVTGIVIHPQAADVMYARTDVGGLYRWDAVKHDWHQLLSMESVGQKVSLSIESVAVDPNNINTVYAATGAGTHTGKGEEIPGNILKSIDRGNTWEVLDLSVPMGGNEMWRWTGERLAVDPHNSNIVYFGSRLDGLWQSQDGGASWNQIDTSNIPVGETWGETKGVAGVTFIEFDESSQGVAYVGVAGKGVYQTTDGGNNWQFLEGIPESLVPQQGEINGDGELVVTLFGSQESSNGGIWNFDGYAWSDITPKSGKNYAGLTVSESDPNTLFSVSYPMTPNDIYRSNDGGDTWTALDNQQQGLDWYPDWNFWTLSGDLAVDPTNSDRVWLTNGIGVWKTEEAQASNSNWSAKVDGIEETVAFDAVSTPGGASLITAIADFDGFRHTDVNATPAHNHSNGEFSTTTSISYSSSNPNFLVRSSSSHHDYSQYSGFSTDNGVTWQKFASIENGTHPSELNFGNIAISASNTDNVVWQGSNWSVPYYTKDGGQNWNRINFFDRLGGGAHTHLWNNQQVLAADSVSDGTFYLYHHTGGQLMRTQDGGESWTVANQDSLLPSGVWTGANIKTAPGKAGDVWASLDKRGLYHSTDAGKTFTRINSVEDADAIGFGKPAFGSNNPTLFISGEIEGQLGVFGSTDSGNTWSQFTDLPNEFLDDVRSIVGDINDFGRVYLGVGGNGFVYGDLDF